MRLTWIICCVLTGSCWAGCLAAGISAAGECDVPLSVEAAQRLAAELVPQLRDVLGPAKTTLVLALDIREPLRTALEREVRRRGYAVAEDVGETGAIPLTCAIDRIAAQQFRVTVRVGERLEVSRAYGAVDEGRIEPLTQFARRYESEPAAAEGFPMPDAPRVVARDTAPAWRSGEVRGTCKSTNPPPKIATLQKPPPSADCSVAETGGVEKVRAPATPLVSSTASSTNDGAIRSNLLSSQVQDVAAADEEDAIVLSPNREHVIEISGALFANADGRVANPFLQQYQPKVPAHELTVSIAGVAMGPNPTAVLNGRVCSIGESIEGFRVEGIQRDLVTLRWENFMLRIPVAQQSVVVRYP